MNITQRLEERFRIYKVDPRNRDSADYFPALVKVAVGFYDVPVEEIRDDLGVSDPIITRWARGKNLPSQPLARSVAINYLERKVRESQAILRED